MKASCISLHLLFFINNFVAGYAEETHSSELLGSVLDQQRYLRKIGKDCTGLLKEDKCKVYDEYGTYHYYDKESTLDGGSSSSGSSSGGSSSSGSSGSSGGGSSGGGSSSSDRSSSGSTSSSGSDPTTTETVRAFSTGSSISAALSAVAVFGGMGALGVFLMAQVTKNSEEKPNLNNFLNIIAFGLSWIIYSNVGLPGSGEGAGFFGGIGDLWHYYGSIVLPTRQVFFVADLVFLTQGMFTIAQLLPAYRSSIMVQDCVKHYFLVSVVMQFLWSIDVGIDNTVASVLSVIIIGVMFFAVTKILILQARNTDSNQSPEEYWLLRFPFSLHFAWALALIGMSINGFFYKVEIGSAYQVVLGVITILAMAGIGFKMIYKNGPLPNYVVPTIISVVLVGILVNQNTKYHLNLAERIVFDSVVAVSAGLLSAATAYAFYTKEVYPKKNGLLEGDDTVFVGKPDVAEGELA